MNVRSERTTLQPARGRFARGRVSDYRGPLMSAIASATSPSTAAVALSCRGLIKRYPPDVIAVDGLDLEIHRGECFGLLGPNGAGKTTTIEILEGLNTADAGEVRVLDVAWGAGNDRALRERLGIQLQE